jgi:hypothetical protein
MSRKSASTSGVCEHPLSCACGVLRRCDCSAEGPRADESRCGELVGAGAGRFSEAAGAAGDGPGEDEGAGVPVGRVWRVGGRRLAWPGEGEKVFIENERASVGDRERLDDAAAVLVKGPFDREYAESGCRAVAAAERVLGASRVPVRRDEMLVVGCVERLGLCRCGRCGGGERDDDGRRDVSCLFAAMGGWCRRLWVEGEGWSGLTPGLAALLRG